MLEERINFYLKLDLLTNKAGQQEDEAKYMKDKVDILEKEVAELKRKLKDKEEDEASSSSPPQIKLEDEVLWF